MNSHRRHHRFQVPHYIQHYLFQAPQLNRLAPPILSLQREVQDQEQRLPGSQGHLLLGNFLQYLKVMMKNLMKYHLMGSATLARHRHCLQRQVLALSPTYIMHYKNLTVLMDIRCLQMGP